MKLLPFNFDRLESGDYFLSNMGGFHQFLKPDELQELVDFSEISNLQENAQLEAGLFIAPVDVAEVAIAAIGSALARKLTLELKFRPIFMIVPTLRCDHTCRYCQVSRVPLHVDNYDLDESTIPAIIDTIKQISEPPYKLEIQGGEPLVRFDLVNQLYREAEDQLGSDCFEFVVATSLSLLDEGILSWAKDRNVYFSISLDGDAFTHNANRILTGSNSYQKVKRGVSKIQEKLGPDRVSTVTTVTKELLKRPEALIESHLDMGLYDLFVRPVSPYGFANTQAVSTYSIPDYMKFYKGLFEAVKAHNQLGIPLIEHSAAIHMKRIMNPGFSGYADLKSPSGFLLNSILFNYDGKVYGSDEARMLQRVLGDLDLSSGKYNKLSISNNKLYKSIISSSFNLFHPGCEHCAYQPYCGSDPCQSIGVQGEPIGDKSLSLFCQYHKSMFRFLVDQYHTDPVSYDLLIRWCDG